MGFCLHLILGKSHISADNNQTLLLINWLDNLIYFGSRKRSVVYFNFINYSVKPEAGTQITADAEYTGIGCRQSSI